MTDHAETPDRAALDPPVVLIVDADPEARGAAEAVLRRRFAPDYRVLAAASPDAGLAALAGLARQGGDVALVLADLRLPGLGGVAFLERARALHRGTMRACGRVAGGSTEG